MTRHQELQSKTPDTLLVSEGEVHTVRQIPPTNYDVLSGGTVDGTTSFTAEVGVAPAVVFTGDDDEGIVIEESTGS